MPRPTDWNAIGLDSDPTPGDPDQIRTLSTELNHLGSEARRISTAIDAVMNTAGDSVFVGEAANALRDKVNGRLRGHIEDVAQSFESAATALTTWADKLVELQSRADGALNSGRGLSEDDPNRETYASTARQAGTEHGEGASAAAGSISGVSNIQLPISKCQIFWEAFQWLAIILIVPALIFGGPIALLALGVNLTLFIKTIVDFANGDASFLDLFLAGLGILAPTTKALPIFQIIKGVGTTAFAKGFANIARGTFQALRNLFTNGFRPTTLLLGLRDLVKLGSTWVFKGGLWVLDGIHNLPGIIGRGINSAGLTVVQGIKGIPGFVRGLPETFSRGWEATKTWVGQEFGGTKWLRIFLPVDAAEIGEYGFARALRISLFDRGVLGQHVFGAPITSGIGRTISSVPIDPRGVDALVDMPRIQLDQVRFGAGVGQNGIRNLDLHLPSTQLDVTSTLRPPSLNLGDVGAIAHRGNFGVHAARTVDALVDMPHVQLANVHVENFGALGGRSEVGVSAATPTVTTASGLHVPASAGVPGATHGLTNTPVTGVSGSAHTTLTGLHPTPANLTSSTEVLLPGGAHSATHVPGTTVLTGTHATPPPVAGTLGDLSAGSPTAGALHSAFTGSPGVGTVHAPGTPGIGAAHTALTGTPGTTVAHTALDSAPAPGAPHDVTAPNSLLTGPTTVSHPSPTGIGHGGPGSLDTGNSAFDLLAGTRHNTPNTPVAPGTGNALADRTTSALSANQTRLHLDELVHSPGSPHPGTSPQQLLHNTPATPPAGPERLTANPAAGTHPERLTTGPGNAGTPDRFAGNGGPHDPAPLSPGGPGHPGGHGNGAALDLVDTGRSARPTDSPAFAGAPAHTDADKGLAGSANGTGAHVPGELPAHATPTPPATGTPLPGHSSPAPAAHTADTTGAFDDLLKDPNVVRIPGNHELAVKAPRTGTPELHGGAAGSGLFTVDKLGTGFVVRQLDVVGGTVVHSWTFKRLGGLRLAEETVRFGDGPFDGVSVKVAGKTVDSVSDGAGTWPAKLGGEDQIVVASASGSHVYSRSTGELLHSAQDVPLPPHPEGLTGPAADSWNSAARSTRGHMGRAAADNDVKLFMQGVIGGAFTSKKGYGGFVKPSALEGGLVGKVKQFNKIAGELMFEGPNQRMTVWRGVSMDPRAAQADSFVERLPASTSNDFTFQAEWAKNGVNSNRVVFEIDVPADHGKFSMAYPPGYERSADDAIALNQDQREVTLSPTRLVRSGPARVENGITVVPVRAEQIPEAQLEGLINAKWSGLPSGEAFEDFGRAFGQDAIRRWEGLGDAIVREGGDGPNVKTFTVGRPGHADEMTITVTHKVDDDAVSVSITGGDRTFSREWSGTGFNDLAADLRGHVLHNNELLSSLPTPTSWSRELPSPVRPGTHAEGNLPSPTRGTPDTAPRPHQDSAHAGGQELPGRGSRLTPTQIEEAWFRDGRRVDALFGDLGDPMRGARREAWRDHVQARYDLGRAEDLVPHNGHAGSSRGPTPDEIRARENAGAAQQRYDATHHRLTELGVDPARMETDLAALRQISLRERPRLLGGTVLSTSDDATPPPASAVPAAHGESGAASVTPPRRLNDILADQTRAHQELQQAEIKQTQTGKDAAKVTEARTNLAEADTKLKDATRELDDALRHELDNRLLSQRELNQLVDQFAGAGDIGRARKLQAHAQDLNTAARGTGDGPVRSDQFIRTGEEIQSQSVTVRRLANELESLVTAGATPHGELKGLAEGLEQAAKDLDAALQGHVTDAARFGGTYTLRNQHTPVAAVAHHLAELVDDAVKAAKPGDSLVLKGFLGTDASVERVQRGIPDLLRRYRENQAFGDVHTGEQWKAVLPGTEAQWQKVFDDFDGFDKLSRSQQHDFVRNLSEKNITDLRTDVGNLLNSLPPAERAQFEKLLTSLQDLPYRIKHATPAYHAIANSGVMSSQGDLARRGVRFLASGKSSAKNTSNLGNDDFVFFRMEAGDKPMATRYGPTTLVFDAKVLEERGGWVSLHDQLHPLDRDTMNQLKFGDETVRGAKYDEGFDEVGKRGRWTYEYPGGRTRQVSFEQEVFHGAHVQEALALSVVREVHLIGGGFKDDVFRLLADTTTPEELGSVISKLYRPEAKFGSGLPINPHGSHVTSEWPSPLKVHDADGDGRYLADGSVDPAARAAGKAFDEASDKVRQADNAFKSGNAKAQRYNLNKAQPHAEQAVKLTQEFHAASVGERKAMAQTLLDQREQLLKDINGRLDALKSQNRPETGGAQPRPGRNQGAGASSSSAVANGPDLSPLRGTAEDALGKVTGITDQMKKMVRALGNSDGFRALENSRDGVHTTAAVDLGRTGFDKAYKHLNRAGLVVGDAKGLHFTPEGRRLFLPPGSETRTPALAADGLPSHTPDTHSPAPHTLDTSSPAPHDLSGRSAAPHDLNTHSPAPHDLNTHSPAPHDLDATSHVPGPARRTPDPAPAPHPDTPHAGDQELPGRADRLTPAQIEEAWFRDGQRVDALFGHADDPLRQARREAWRDHVQARYDLGRAEDLLPHNGHAGNSNGPTAAEIRARQNVDAAGRRYEATHGRLADLGVDPVRMEADLANLRQLSLKERPRVLGGTSLPADSATPPPVHSAPTPHSETEAAVPLTPPQQLAKSLGEHTDAQRGVQQAESNLANATPNQRPAVQAALDKANDEASRIAVRLDEEMTQALTDGRLSQRDLNLLVDQFAGAGDIQRALRFQEHALDLDARARHTPEGAGADHFIRTGKEIEQQSLELRGLTQRLERLVGSGKKTPLELQGLARSLDKAAHDLDASLKGFVRDAAELGGVYTLRNEHAPVSTVAHELARKVDDAVKAAGPEDSVVLKGFHGTDFSISRLQRDMPEIARHLRSNKAYAEVHTGNQWKAELPGSQEQWEKIFPEFEEFEKLSDAQKTRFVHELSERNVTQLRQDVDELLNSLPPAERAQFEKLLTSLQDLPYRIKHATPAYHAIANSGVMSSQGDLTRRGIRFLASGKSSGKNTSNLGNDDFVFFRMEAGDKPMATRYGPTTLVFDAKVLEERGGWVSLHDQLHPLDRETMRDLKSGDQTVRSAAYDKGYEEMGKRARWTYEYPVGGGSRTVSFDQEVFHGAHVQEALALSVVREVHLIGGGFKDDVLRLVQGPVDVEQMGAVVSKLYRPEAKFGSGLPINPFSSQVESRWPKPLAVHDMEGDGRYLADGTVDPAARAAGKAFDEASDKVRQADNAVVGNNRKAQRYNLNKAQPLAEQAVKLTQEFHGLAQGARKEMAKGLLDERTKLLDDINGRIGDLRARPDTDAVKAQPGSSTGTAQASSSKTVRVPKPAVSTGPDAALFKELPQHVEKALGDSLPVLTDDMRKMARALANSDGMRALRDSRREAQTQKAVGLGKDAFGSAFEGLRSAGLVRGDKLGLHLTDDGRKLLLPPKADTGTLVAPPSTTADVHLPPAHAESSLTHTPPGPETKPAPSATDGTSPHPLDTGSPTPHALDTHSPAPRDLDTKSPAPHDLDTKSPAPHHADTDTSSPVPSRTGTQAPAPIRVDSETAAPLVKEGDTTVSHATDHDAVTHPLDAQNPPRHLSDATAPHHTAETETEGFQPHPLDTGTPPSSPLAKADTTTAHLSDTETRTPHLTGTDTTPPHPAETDTTATHLDDVHAAPPRHGGDDLVPPPPRDGARPGGTALDDILGPPRRTGDTTTTAAPGTARPAATDHLDRDAFRRDTYRENGIRARSQIRHVDRALETFHRVPADRLAQRAQALDNLADAARNFLRDRPDSVRRAGVQRLLDQVRAEANAYRLLDDFRRLGGDGDGLAGRTRTALAAGGTTPETGTRLQSMLDGMDDSARAQRQNDALSLLVGTPPLRNTGDTTRTAPPRPDGDTTPPAPVRPDGDTSPAAPATPNHGKAPAVPSRQPGQVPWAEDSARFDELLGGEGRPFHEAWVELSSARIELNRVEDLRAAPGGAGTSRGVSEFDVQLNHELISAHERFRTAYTNLEDLGVRPTEIEARITEIEKAATRRGATLGAGRFDPLPDTAPPAVNRIDLNDSGVSGPNGLTIERSVGQDNAVTLRVLDQHSHPDPTRTVVARQDGGFDVRHTQSDTVDTYTANGDRTAYDMPLLGADGRPTGLRLHTDINGHGTRQALTVNGPGADRLTAFPLPGDAARITHLDTGATRRVDPLGLQLDEGVQLTGRDGVPTGADRVRVTDGGGVHVTDLAGDRLDLRVQDLGDGNGIRVTDETTGVSVRHDGRGRLQETGIALTDPRGTRGQRYLADDGTGGFTLTDASGARQTQPVTVLPGGAGFRVTDGTSGATSRFAADGRYRETGLALFDPAVNARGDRILVPDGAGGHRLTDAAGQPLPQRVVAVGGNRPRTIDDVTGESVLYDTQGRPLSTSTALTDPAGGPRGTLFAEPDGAGGHRLTDAGGGRLPDTVTALPNDGGFRTVHGTGHRGFAANGDFTGDGLRLAGRDGLPAGRLDRPLGAAPRWLDDAFAADPARAVTVDPAGRIEVALPGGGRQVFDGTSGRFVEETVPLPGGGHRTTLADGSFTRHDGHGTVTANGTPLPAGHGGRLLVVEPPTAVRPGGTWVEDGAGGRLAHWDAVRNPDGTARISFDDRTSPRHGEFVELAADGTPVRQGFNVLDAGARTNFRYVVDHTAGTWERTALDGTPTAAGAFHHGTVDLSGAANGHIRLLGSTKTRVPVFERRVLPGAAGDAVDAFRRTDTIAFARTNPRTHWVRWDETGIPAGTGSRHYDTAGTGWRDTDRWGRTVREYRDGLQKFDGRAGHTLGVHNGDGGWTWHRYDGAGRQLASGPRTREHLGAGWTDRTAGGGIAQRQWGMAEWPERAGQYQEHAMSPDGSLRGTWERHSPHGKEVGKHEVFGDGFLTTDRWREQRPPTLVRTRWLTGAEHTRPPYAHVRGDDTYQMFTWSREANDGGVTASGVRYVGMDGSALDLAADGSFARFSGKLHDGTSLKVGDHAGRPGHAPANPADQPWQAGAVRGYREQLAGDPAGRLWQDVHQDAGGTTHVAREGLPGGVVREYTGLPADRRWVERDPHGNLVGQSHARPDRPGHVIQGSGRADSGRWTWRELDADGGQVTTGRREHFRGSTDSRLPWDDSYRDFDAGGQLVRERRMLDSGGYVDSWRGADGRWSANAFRRDGTALDPALANQTRRWWHGGAWHDQWAPGSRHFRDQLPGAGQGAAPTVLRETPLHNGGPVRVRTYDTAANTPGSVWKEYDHGGVVRERKAEGNGFLETDAWRGQWNRYSDRGDLIAQRTDNGLVFERDTFGRMRLTGNEYDFRGPLTEIRGWGRTTREAQRMPWSGTVLPNGDAALREARYEPYWRSVAKKAALEFGQEFILEFGANLAVNGIVAAVQHKQFTGKDALKSFANAAVGATIKTGLTTAVHENRAFGFEKLGSLKAGVANIDGGKPWTRRPMNHDKTWVNEWAGNETPTRWRGGTYDFSFGVLSSALSGWVNGSMNAAVWGVTNADGQTVKLHGGDAVWEGGINAAASVTTAATTGLVKNVFVMSAGSRLFHRQGFADFWIQLPFKIFEKSIQSLYLTSAYRASINPTYYQAP
ncbi:hypothetical protein [Streptomyces sp. NPDC093970]|uniref:hypothetical protein n=1 Tax=Streptomyces sp. NPDC093970 TaxID=3155076 RepID=UPI0034489E1A